MAIPRASSSMLRSNIIRRPAAVATPLRRMQIRTQMDDLGGPGGQEKPPSRPAGPDTLKRNWYVHSSCLHHVNDNPANTLLRPAIGGVALVLVGAYAYFTGGAPKAKAKEEELVGAAKERAEDLKKKGEGEIGKIKKEAEEDLQKIKEKETYTERLGSTGVDHLSGRKPGGYGGFRSE